MTATSNILAGSWRLLLGLATARAIGILSMPIIARLYSPHDFAVLAIYVAMVSLLSPFTSLRYSLAIPLPRTDILAINIAAVSVVIGISSVTMVMIAAFIIELWPISFSVFELLYGYIWLVPIGLLFTGAFEIASFWSMRHKAFGVIAKVNVKQAVNGNLAKILLGFLGFKPIGLILGHILSQGSGIAPQLRHGFPGIRVLLPMITVQRMRKSLIQYWHFPVFQLPSQLFSIGAEQAPTLFIAAMYQGEQVGNFALAMAAITLPVSLVAKTLSKSFYAGIADLGRHQVREAMDIGLYILKRIILVTVLIGVVTFLLAGQLIPLVFGTQWGLAGAIVEQMVPYLIGVIVFTSVSGILDVFHRQDLRLRLDIQRFILVITLLFWASKTNMAFIDFIKAYSVTLLIHFLISTVSVFLCLRNLRNAGSTDNFPA